MKMTLESPTKMVLADHNYSQFIMGFVFFLIGIAIAILFTSQGIIGIAFGAIFALAGLFVVASTKMITVTFDKGVNKGSLSLKGLIGGGQREFELGRVKKLTLKKHISTSSSRNGSSTTYNYSVGMGMDDGDEIQFKLANVSAGINTVLVSPDEKQKEFAKKIADFLGVPFEYIPPPSMADVLSSIKEGIEEGMRRQTDKQP